MRLYFSRIILTNAVVAYVIISYRINYEYSYTIYTMQPQRGMVGNPSTPVATYRVFWIDT